VPKKKQSRDMVTKFHQSIPTDFDNHEKKNFMNLTMLVAATVPYGTGSRQR
jgi:hypothetical protein